MDPTGFCFVRMFAKTGQNKKRDRAQGWVLECSKDPEESKVKENISVTGQMLLPESLARVSTRKYAMWFLR